MKFRNLLLATVACAGLFTACSNGIDEAIDNGGNETNNGEKAYASFAIQMPAGTGFTRAVGTEVGDATENKVKDVTLLFFDAEAGKNNNLTDIKIIKVDKLNDDATYKIEDLVVTKGSRNIYAFVNAQEKIKAFSPNDNGYAYGVITGIGEETAASMSVDNGFTMSNAATVNSIDVKYTKKEDANENPVSIKVERTVAKVIYTGDNFNFEVKRADGATVGNVTLTDIELINQNTKYFYLRRVSENAAGSNPIIGGDENDGKNYVVDPNFTEKKPVDGDNWTRSNQTIAKDVKFYCLENTMNDVSQYNGVTTGAMFKAKFAIAGGDATGNIYRHNGMLYGKESDIKTLLNINEDTSTWGSEEWAEKNVTFYKGGICYYPYWIKHVDNGKPTEMGIMEYGVVRNNVYKLQVSSISGIGAPTDKIDPENPDEVLSSFITVSVQVLKWTIRSNEDIIL